jgi:mono/diheme cytochrome c family protein
MERKNLSQKKIMKARLKYFIILFTLICTACAIFINTYRFQAPREADKIKNPLPGDSASARYGKEIFEKRCYMCHGENGRGDGPILPKIGISALDELSPRTKNLSDGAIYWMISNGNSPMPAYFKMLSEKERWSLVNYIRSLQTQSHKKPLSTQGFLPSRQKNRIH